MSDYEIIREALTALHGWLPEPQNKAASKGYDQAIVGVRRKHTAAMQALLRLETEATYSHSGSGRDSQP